MSLKITPVKLIYFSTDNPSNGLKPSYPIIIFPSISIFFHQSFKGKGTLVKDGFEHGDAISGMVEGAFKVMVSCMSTRSYYTIHTEH